MLAPRSYHFAPPPVLSKTDAMQEKRRMSPKSRPENTPPTTSATPGTSPPSKPVLIPSSSKRSVRKSTHDPRTGNTRRPLQDSLSPVANLHRPDVIPPAVAALLAVTSIPPQKNGTLSRRRKQAVEKQTYWPLHSRNQAKSRGTYTSPNARSAMNILLSPPDEADLLEAVARRDGAAEATMCTRSKSSDSVPSLETDDESSVSWGSPPTPRNGMRKAGGERRGRQLSSPPAEDCQLDHPLLHSSFDTESSSPLDYDTGGKSVVLTPVSTSGAEHRKVSFKSNLTASLRVLKSAARSFSNFSAPLIQPDDFLTRSILSITPLYTDEKRPLPLEDAPTPALRRYLNPMTNASAEMYSHGGTSQISLDRCTASIQLQTYRVSRSRRANASPIVGRRSNQRSAEDPFAAASSLSGPVPRQREVRENSDFLRVIVLEMNMRRGGKLSDKAQGKARFVLPPRQPSNRYVLEDGAVPARWIPVVLEEEVDVSSN